MNNWNLEKLYTSFESDAFQSDLAKLDIAITRLNEYKEKFNNTTDNKTTLEDFFNDFTLFGTIYSKLSQYSYLRKSTNTTDKDAIKYLNLILNKESEIAVVEALASKWVASLDLENLFAESELLKTHSYYLNLMKEGDKYKLDEKTELLLAKLDQSGGNAWGNLQGLLTSTLDVEITINNEEKVITLPEVRNLAYDKDANIRKVAYEAELKSYAKIEKSIAASLNSIKAEVNTMSEFRGYDGALDKALIDSEMTKETLDSLIEAIKEYLPYFRKYLQRKGELLGHKNGLPFYDLFAPIGNVDKTFTIPEAQDYILENFGTFSDSLKDLASRAFNENWVDYSPKKGKVGGAFCANIHPLKESRVLHNFTGTFSDVLTLAHELGHAYHGDCIFKETLLNSHYTMPVAETASIMCENIVMKRAIADASENEKLFILESSLQDITQVAVDILSRYIFEDSVFTARKDTVLSPEELNNLMLEAQKASYGDGLDQDLLHPYMWVCKGHYYSSGLSFYNFPYAFGALFGKGLYSQYIKDKDNFVPKYDNLLRLTGQMSVEEVAKLADIDVTSIDFWRSSLDQVKEDIELFLELTK